jgi:two-component sensor histidine kinase
MINNSVFSHVINNFLEHVYVLNDRREIVFQTENNSSLLGFTEEEIRANGFPWLFVNPLFSFNDVLQDSIKYGEIYGTENFKHKTKKFINIAFRIQCIEDAENKQPLFVFYLRDNTQQNLVRKDILKKSLTIENLSRSRRIRDGEIEKAIYEILESSSRAMNTTRVNAWIFDEDKTRIQCVGNFDARVNKLVPQTDLPRIAMPFYFRLFETEKIILTRDSFNETKTAELYDFYLKPNNIQSLMDVPVRIEGEMVGVICFENVGAPRVWTLQEQKYGLVAAQMLSLTIESHNKQKAKLALEIALNEQTILLQEVNHRVKNNLAIVGSLLNMQAEKSNDEFHKQLFMECRNRIDSIASVHELIYKAKSYAQLNFKEYLNHLVDHITESYKSIEHIKIIKGITDVHINIAAAIPLGLMVNELITNAYKHAFTRKTEGQIEVILLENNNQVFLTIKDNGNGFDKNVIPKNSIGMDILGGLIEQIDGTYTLTSDENGTSYKISFSKK